MNNTELNINDEPFITLKMEKKQRLMSLLKTDININRLKVLGMSRFGLVDNEVRKNAWLEMHNIKNKKSKFKDIDENMILNHKDYQQVLMDVNRSLKRFPPGMDDVVRMAMQDQLVNLIVKILITEKGLHYYQGFHDVCVTFLLVLNEEESYNLICFLCRTHFIDFMASNMDATMQLLYLIYGIIELEDKDIIFKLQQVSLEPYFALSWVITWFGHVLGDLASILRLYDFFLASDPIMPIYLSAAIVLHRRADINKTETDFAQLHHMLTNLPPPSELPLEYLLSQTMNLYLRHSPCDILTSNALPYQLNSRLTTLCSEILRNKRGPVGDAIDTRHSNFIGSRNTSISVNTHSVVNFLTSSRSLIVSGVFVLILALSFTFLRNLFNQVDSVSTKQSFLGH